jgi:hypothetical protein
MRIISRAFITIQSSSPRTSPLSFVGSVHVLDRPHDLAILREHRLFGQSLADCLSDPEVDDLGDGLVVVLRNENVRWR